MWAAGGRCLFCEAGSALLYVVVEFYDAVFERDGPLPDAQEGRDGRDKVVVVFGADELDLALPLGDKVLESGEVGLLLLGAVDVDQDGSEWFEVCRCGTSSSCCGGAARDGREQEELLELRLDLARAELDASAAARWRGTAVGGELRSHFPESRQSSPVQSHSWGLGLWSSAE